MKWTEARKTKATLTAVFFTFFIDNLSWSIVFPIFAPYFLNGQNHLFSPEVSMATRTTILGFFLTAFSLGQFFGAPFLGEYADRHGRKKAFLWSIFFTLAGLGVSAWSMQMDNLYLLFAGRLVTGFFAGNMTICLACIADIHEDPAQKVKHFGYLSLVAGFAFIIGAFLGGKLSDPSISSFFFPAFPLWLGTGLTLVNLLFIFWGFKETAFISKSPVFSFRQSVCNIIDAFHTHKIKQIYGIYFLFLFAWTMLFQFIPVLVVREFGFTNSNLGDLALFMGVCWGIGSGYLNKLFIALFSPLRTLEVCLLLFTVLCGAVVFTNHIYWILGIVAGCVIVGGLAWPLCNGVISSAAPREVQGKILGISQSVQSLSMALAPAIGGIAYQVFSGFPFVLGAAASLLAGIIYFTLKE